MILGALLGSTVWGEAQALMYALALAGGIAGALLVIPLFYAAVFLVGAAFGCFIAAVILRVCGLPVHPLILVVPGLATGVLILFYDRLMMTLATAAGGAWSVAVCLFALIHASDLRSILQHPFLPRGGWLGLWFALSLLGVVAQYLLWPAPKTLRKKAAPATSGNHDAAPPPGHAP